MRSLTWFAIAILAVFAVVKLGGGSGGQPAGAGHDPTLTIHFNAINTYNTVTISPSDVQCGHYHGGKFPNASTNTLGQPNGMCSVGRDVPPHVVVAPIKITYSGLSGSVFIQSGNAVPKDNGTQWHLCGPNIGPESVCHGPQGKPGPYQFSVKNFNIVGLGPTSLRPWPTCDVNFDVDGRCHAHRTQSQQEGFNIIGPYWQKNPSTTWSVTITWIAMPAK
ncbi:MAG TPA: hypothetical protein VIX86_21180 [Streptosporangiaceae bacterium]